MLVAARLRSRMCLQRAETFEAGVLATFALSKLTG
jgi:hypothetical protein